MKKVGRKPLTGVTRSVIKRVRLTPSEFSRLQAMDIDPAEFVRAIAQARINTLKKRGEYVTPEPTQQIKSEPNIINGNVYFILAPTIGRVKIGYTAGQPQKRLAALQVGSADVLTLIGYFPGSMEDEFALHQRFRSSRVSGEWFTVTDDIRRYIKTVCGEVPE